MGFGKMGKGFNNFKFGVTSFTILITISLFLFSVTAAQSPSTDFNVTPTSVNFNWSDGVLNFTSNLNGLTLVVSNSSTTIISNYSQTSHYSAGNYPGLTSSNIGLCTSGNFLVSISGSYTNTTGVLNNTNSTLVNLQPHLHCPPGQYRGNFNVYNSTNSSDSISVSATVDVPITSSNTFNSSYNNATFKGNLTAGNTNYHSYYFNTSLESNATGLTLALTGLSDDVDLFLFDGSGNNLASSVKSGTNSEELVYTSLSGLPSNEVWEIRVYGNVTSNYTGGLYLSTLNFTNTTDGSTLPTFDYGAKDVNGTGSFSFNLTNEDDVSTTPTESLELYHLTTITNQNSTQNLTVLVPSFAEKVEALLQWTPTGDVTDWDVYLYDINGLVANSTTKYLSSNTTGALRTERIEYSTISTSNQGPWIVEIKNASSDAVLDQFNLTVKIYMPASTWLDTSFTTQTLTSGQTTNVTANLSVSSNNVLNGSYQGRLKYTDGSSVSQLFVTFDVNAGHLLVNNTLGSTSSVATKENIGFNNTVVLNITYNNTGGYPIHFANSNSSGALFLSSNSSKYVNFTAALPSSPLSVGASGLINITMTINTDLTGNTAGIYTGWIFFNTTNSTLNSQSYPYQTHNLTIDLNLTSQLNSATLVHNPTMVGNVSQTTPITINISVETQNGTALSRNGTMDLNNFSTVWIAEKNVTSYTATLTGLTNATNPVCSAASPFVCSLNATVPANLPGGYYAVYTNFTHSTNGVTLSGTGVNATTLVINNTGLKLTAVDSTTISINEGGVITYFNATVTNFGPIAATGTLNITTHSYATIVADTVGTNCGSAGSSTSMHFNINIDANGTETCWYRWKITSVSSVSSDQSSTLYINSTNANFGNLTLSLTVKNTDSTNNDDGGGGGSQNTNDDTTTPEPTKTESMIISSAPSTIEFLAGSSKSVEVRVKNTGEADITTKLQVSGLTDKVAVSITPSEELLSVDEESTFTITFSGNDIGSFSGTFKATGGSASDSKGFTLTVLPTDEKKTEISETYQAYLTKVGLLGSRFNQLKSAGCLTSTTGNETVNSTQELSSIESDLSNVKSSLDSAKSGIDSQDYIAANNKLGDANLVMESVSSKLDAMENIQQSCLAASGSGATALLIGGATAVVIGIVVVGLLYAYYTRLPSGYSHESGWRSSFKRNVKPIKPEPKTYGNEGGYMKRNIEYKFKKRR